MFRLFANGILSLVVLGQLSSLAAAEPTAKGGSLVVRTNDGRKHFTLKADATWQLNVKGRFDASALAFYQGSLITVNDQDGSFHQISPGTNSIAELKKLALFPPAKLQSIAPRRASRYDLEGIAIDPSGAIYVSEESQRLVFKSSPDGKNIDALQIDWSPVKKFFTADINASFEGIALSGNKLFLANERSGPRIIVIDLDSRRVTDSFFVDSEGFAFGGPHYSDLAFSDGHLFILNRNHRCILEVDPEKKRVVAEYAFGQMELGESVAYRSDYPTGAMEGLAIEKDFFWLITDNNGRAKFRKPDDIRPTLFRCKRSRN